ncbi:MAG TPA: ABC transporter ATP-binding protein [candidate division Zixibacteria bacterium]|nr:ABC transporter ATP-binding protein [candidate division Zixibacteria bacterium]
MATVTLTGLTKRFAETAAVEDLHLEIADGEFVSLLGPSGCGKSTTLRLIAGFLQPDAGEIRVGGGLVSSPSVLVPPERRSMSMIFQSYAVWPHMTVAQNVAYGLKFKKLSRREMDRRVERFLKLVRLESLKDRYPAELSGGQQQRVALARALVVEPQILLMDEPLSNLDANLREEMRFEIRRLHEEVRITTVYVTHDQAEAMATSDRIAVLNAGRIIQVGAPTEIFDRPKTRFVAEFVGKTNILSGRFEGADTLLLGNGGRVRVAGNGGPSGGEGIVCLRPHNIVLAAGESEARQLEDRGYNVFSGVIRRSIYFGDAIDYTIELPSSPVALRVLAPPSQRYALNQPIYAAARPEHCVVLKER